MSIESYILDKIRETSFQIAKNECDQKDLTQSVSLIYLEKPELFNNADNLKGYIFTVVMNTLKRKDRPFYSLDVDLVEEPVEELDIDRVKTLSDMLNELPEIERLWILIYIDSKFNYSAIERATGITRQCAKKRIKLILNRWKQLDIYLP